MKRSLAKLSRRFAAKAPAANVVSVQPTFDEGDLFSDLIEPASAKENWRDGQNDAAWTALLNHFSQRETPRLFFAPTDVSRLLEETKLRFPSWRERLLSKVEADRREGLAIYDRCGAPLTAEFDWNVAPDNPLHDRLYLVRPHRFGFLPRWALACHYDSAYVAPLQGAVAKWIAQASELKGGPGFSSSHIVCYRIVAFLLAWPFLASLDNASPGDTSVPTLQRHILQIFYEDCRYLSRVAGAAAANNHLLADLFGCWLIARCVPEYDFGLDRAQAETAWLNELRRQTYEDGGSFEHSLHYHEHACEMGVAYLLLSRTNGWEIPAWAESRIERMLNFQLCLTGPDLIPLLVGNTTEDPLLPLGASESWQTGALREIYRSCFRSEIPGAPANDATFETAFWLLNGELADPPEPVQRQAEFSAFQDSGFHVFADPAYHARLVHRLGPAPDKIAIGGHTHNDLLSVHMSIDGRSVLAGPGTYSYRHKPHPDLPDGPNLRAYFSSAQSRSGLFLADQEHYGPLTGDFRNWDIPCHVEQRDAHAGNAGLSWDEGVVVGTSAYAGYRRGIIHVWGRYWLIYDVLPPQPNHRRRENLAEVGWQFAPGIHCTLNERGAACLSVDQADELLFLVPCNVGRASLENGSVSPFRGWIAPSYGKLEPAANLRYKLDPANDTFAFLLDPSSSSHIAPELELPLAQENTFGFVVTDSQSQALILLNSGNSCVETVWGGVTFTGRLLHVDHDHDGTIRVRALGMQHLQIAEIELELTVSGTGQADIEMMVRDGQLTWPHGQNRDVTVSEHTS